MRIIKNSITRDERTRMIFEIFDKILVRLDYPWKLETLEFSIGDKNSVFVKEKTAMISINYNDSLIQDMDKKAMISMILHGLYHIIIHDKYNLQQLPHFIEDILINREMINNGYDDYVFHMSYLFLIRKKQVNNVEEYLEVNTPWLSFYQLNNYNLEFLKNTIKKIKNKEKYEEMAKKLIDSLKKDLTKDNNLNYALNVYEVMLFK